MGSFPMHTYYTCNYTIMLDSGGYVCRCLGSHAGLASLKLLLLCVCTSGAPGQVLGIRPQLQRKALCSRIPPHSLSPPVARCGDRSTLLTTGMQAQIPRDDRTAFVSRTEDRCI